MKNNQKGFAAAFTLLLAATLAVISYKIITIGLIGIRVNTEKQLLDSCSIIAGQKIIKTNDILGSCDQSFLNDCARLVESSNGQFECVDLGVECDEENTCKRIIEVFSTYNPGIREVTKNVEVHINEESHEVENIDAAVIMLLDFSGSMKGQRISQLKNAVREFVQSRFDLSYSVIIYNNDIMSLSNIGKGLNHDQSILTMLNTYQANGGTNFVKPLSAALNKISINNYESYYILLISDGSPNEGSTPSINFVNNNIMSLEEENCINPSRINPCITVFTLGVDNADIDTLTMLSGNTISRDPQQYSYLVNSNQTSNAFNAIIEEIICRIGPVLAEENLNVFNNLTKLEENIDYIYDVDNKILKFYDSAANSTCTDMILNNAIITLRWGKPKLVVK